MSEPHLLGILSFRHRSILSISPSTYLCTPLISSSNYAPSIFAVVPSTSQSLAESIAAYHSLDQSSLSSAYPFPLVGCMSPLLDLSLHQSIASPSVRWSHYTVSLCLVQPLFTFPHYLSYLLHLLVSNRFYFTVLSIYCRCDEEYTEKIQSRHELTLDLIEDINQYKKMLIALLWKNPDIVRVSSCAFSLSSLLLQLTAPLFARLSTAIKAP